MKRPSVFDVYSFYTALDVERQSLKKNWKEVAAESKVSASTLTRMKQGKRPDVDSMAALSAWSGLNPSDFIIGGKEHPVAPLTQVSALLRGDPNLSPEAATAIDELVRATYERLRLDNES